jgi:hypothetical protein
MAASLVDVYRAVAADRSGGAPVTWTAR